MYTSHSSGFYRGSEPLTNFTCEITKQLKKHDGDASETWLTLRGKCGDEELHEIEIPATQLGKMDWVAAHWGIKPIIYPLPNAERDLKAAIQSLSEPETEDLYTHTGWTQINDKNYYLHGGGGIGEEGNDPSIRVDLPRDLRHYDLTTSKHDPKTAFRASVDISRLGPPQVTWPMLLAVYRAVLDECDFGLHLSGKTGTFKSELCSLIQSHWGTEMDARHLPSNWSSTGNAIEAAAYKTKDAILTIDDFVPSGSTYGNKSLNKIADQVFRGQGNQAGRQRLTDTSRLNTTYYPRGLLLSTGEDVPTGASLRARILLSDLSPGDIQAKDLSVAQGRRAMYPAALSDYLQYLSPILGDERKKLKKLATQYRDKHRDIGHARTPSMIGQLRGTLESIMRYGLQKKYVTSEEAAKLMMTAEESLDAAGRAQKDYIMDYNPADAFVETVRGVLAGHLAHIRTRSGGIPEQPSIMGWTESRIDASGIPHYKASGPTLGWVDMDKDEIYIDQQQFPFLSKHSHGKLSASRQTMLKRLKDEGILARVDDLRQRNTMRVMLGGSQRTVITLGYPTVFGEDDGK